MGSKRGRNRQLTKKRIKEVLEEYDHSFMTTSELVDHVPVSRPVVVDRLEELVEQGEVETRKTSNMRIWWLAGRVATSPNERVVGDELFLDLDDRLREDLEEHAEGEDKTPEKAAVDLLATGLEESAPLWEVTKSVGAAFSILMLLALVVQSRIGGIIEQIMFGVTGLVLALFASLLVAYIMLPVIKPAVNRSQEWWVDRKES